MSPFFMDENDAEFGKFRIWQDLDQDGESDVGELRTLSEAEAITIDTNWRMAA